MTTNFDFATDTRLRAAQYLSPGYCARSREGGLWLLTAALLVSCCCPWLVKLSVAPPRKLSGMGRKTRLRPPLLCVAIICVSLMPFAQPLTLSLTLPLSDQTEERLNTSTDT